MTTQTAAANIPIIEKCPFLRKNQLNRDLNDVLDHPHVTDSYELPGYPDLLLGDKRRLVKHLDNDLCSADLDELAPKLWMLSSQSSSNISPLHRQNVKGRVIIITEDPKLHLTWIGGRIFIKPLPLYLSSWAFWNLFLLSDASPLGHERRRVKAWAIGYLRTYSYLIRYQSDFRIAKREELLPEHVTWGEFRHFSKSFLDIPDREVAPRYAFGELRLSRLNFYAKILLPTMVFQRVHHQYGAYFAQFFGPILFVLGILSVMLSAMQVQTSVVQLRNSAQDMEGSWRQWIWFSTFTLYTTSGIGIGLSLILVAKFCKEWYHALRCRFWKKDNSSLPTFI